MSKIQVTLDATKLRSLVAKRTYKNKDNADVEVQEVKFELIAVKEPKTIYTGNGYRIDKTHFASVIQTKEQREAKAETIFIGDGFTTVWENTTVPSETHTAVPIPQEEHDDLPF